jgi:hypothetical protein
MPAVGDAALLLLQKREAANISRNQSSTATAATSLMSTLIPGCSETGMHPR